MSDEKVKVFTGSGSFNIQDEMLKDSKDLLDNVEVTTIAQECVRLKTKEDELVSLEEQVKNKKEEIDEISSRIIPELLAEQGLSAIKLADGSNVSVKKEFRCTLPKDEAKREQAYKWLRDQGLHLEREKMTRRNNCWTLQLKMDLIRNRNLMRLGIH